MKRFSARAVAHAAAPAPDSTATLSDELFRFGSAPAVDHEADGAGADRPGPDHTDPDVPEAAQAEQPAQPDPEQPNLEQAGAARVDGAQPNGAQPDVTQPDGAQLNAEQREAAQPDVQRNVQPDAEQRDAGQADEVDQPVVDDPDDALYGDQGRRIGRATVVLLGLLLVGLGVLLGVQLDRQLSPTPAPQVVYVLGSEAAPSTGPSGASSGR